MLCHELGHDQLHRALGKAMASGFMLYATSVPECRSQIVASEILIDNDELFRVHIRYRYSAEQIARQMIPTSTLSP